MGKIDLERHRELEADGFLSIQNHRQFPLLIHNYTPKAQYDRFWIPETLMCRGLITDEMGNIVARPFPKFFNLDEYITYYGKLPDETFEVHEKMDGSLGILYFLEGRPHVATRGSFHSEQAEKATQILHRKYQHLPFQQGRTYLFEIIYPENRIVIDYGDQEDLVLLGIIDSKTGLEYPHLDFPMPIAPHFPQMNSLEKVRQFEQDNREGFVLKFKGGLRVKVKMEEYVRLHRIITGVNKRTIWEYLKEGTSLDDLLDKVPDEFYQWVKRTAKELKDQFKEIEQLCKSELREFPTRKETAQYFRDKGTHPKILFLMLDNKPYEEAIWKLLYPPHEKAFSSFNGEGNSPTK